jgi:PAS domain S-box-containing protein
VSDPFQRQLASLRRQATDLAIQLSEFRQAFEMNDETSDQLSALEAAIASFTSGQPHSRQSSTPCPRCDEDSSYSTTLINHQVAKVLDDILSTSPDLVFVQDRLGRYTYLNSASTQVLGVERTFFLGKSFRDLELPTETINLLNDQRETVITQKKSVSGEITLPTVYHNDRVFEYTFSPVYGVEGNVETVVFTARDVNDRKQAIDALQVSEEKYRFLFDAATDAIFIVESASGAILNANWSAARQLGYSRKELFQLTIDQIEAPMSTARRAAILQRLEIDGNITFEHFYRRKDGGEIPVEISAQMIEYGDRIAIQSFARDITERKRAEIQLSQSEEKFRQLAENIRELFWVSEPSTKRFVYINPACEEVWGYSSDYFYQNSCFLTEIVYPEDRSAVLRTLIQEMSGVGVDIEYRIVRPDGEVRWVHDRSFPVYNEAGEIYRLVGIAEDITERKRQETALRHSEMRYRAIVEDQTELICRTLPDGTITFVNQAYCRFFNQSFSELIGQNYLTSLPVAERERIQEIDRELSPDSPVKTYGYQEVNANGEVHWLQWRKRAIFDEQGEIIEIQAVGHDITAVKQAELEIRTLNAELEARVSQRTAELKRTNDELVTEIVERYQTEQKLNLVLQAARLGSWELDLTTGELHSSEQCKANFGLPPEVSLSYEQFTEIIYPDDRTHVRELVRQSIETQTDYEAEYRCVWGNGSIHWIWAFGRPTYSVDGVPLRLNGISLDVTERKQTEQALQSSQAKLSDVLNNAITAFCCFRVYANRDWSYDYYSPGCSSIYGYSSEELMADKLLWMSRVYPFDLEHVIVPLFEVIFQEKAHTYEYRFYHKDGRLRWHLATLNSRRDEKSDCWIATIVTIDITERKQAEEALRKSEALYKSLADVLPTCLFRKNRQGQLTFANAAFLDFVGLSLDQVMNQTDLAIGNPSDLVEKYSQDDQRIFQTGEILDLIEQVESPLTGERRYIQTIKAPVRDADGQIVEIQGIFWDITERKLIEENLRCSEERFQAFMDNSPIVAFIKDEADRLVYANMNLVKHFGKSREEILHTTEYDIVPPELAAELQARTHEVLTTRQPTQVIETVPDAAGNQRDWLVFRFPLNGTNGQMLLGGVAIEITEQKRAEAALKQREELYRAIVDDQTELICRYSPDDCILTFVNEAYCRYFGRTREELIGSSFLELIPEADWQEVRTFVASLNRENSIRISEHPVIYANGAIRWQQWFDRAFFDDSDRVVEVQSVGRDITERKQAEIALQESEARFRAVFEQSAFGIALVDASGRFIRVNQRFCEFTGYVEAELLTLTIEGITHPDDARIGMDYLRQQWSDGQHSFSIHKRYICKDGQVKRAKITSTLIRNAEGLPQYAMGMLEELSD